jgi:hypothetical protein
MPRPILTPSLLIFLLALFIAPLNLAAFGQTPTHTDSTDQRNGPGFTNPPLTGRRSLPHGAGVLCEKLINSRNGILFLC